MWRHFICLFLFLGFLHTGTAAAQERTVIGTVMEVEGTARITTPAGAAAAAVDTPVYLNDTIETGAASRAVIVFIDDTEMTLSENTVLRVDEYIFDAEDKSENKGVYSVLKGAFIYVSGLIADRIDPDVTVNTPAGTIGIRGTEFWGGEVDGEYGVLVNSGRVNFRTDAGEVLINKGLGATVKDRRQRPMAARVWDKGRMDRAVRTVALKNPAAVRQRIAGNKPRQQMLRQKMKQVIQQRRQQRQQQQRPQQQQQQQLQQQRQQKLQQLQQQRPEMQQKRQQIQQKIQQRRNTQQR